MLVLLNVLTEIEKPQSLVNIATERWQIAQSVDKHENTSRAAGHAALTQDKQNNVLDAQKHWHMLKDIIASLLLQNVYLCIAPCPVIQIEIRTSI